ncbi:MAG: hypothetical protein WDW36_007556 [Sanguina aurantia]
MRERPSHDRSAGENSRPDRSSGDRAPRDRPASDRRPPSGDRDGTDTRPPRDFKPRESSPHEGSTTRDFGHRPVRAHATEEGKRTYRVEVGHEHGVKPGNIIGAIANEAGLESQFIGRLSIRDHYSLIDLPDGMPGEVFEHLKKVWVVQQQLRIHEWDGKDDSSNSTIVPAARKPGGTGRPGGFKSGGPKPCSFPLSGVAHLAAAAHQHLIRLQQGSNAAAADQQQQQQLQQAPSTQQPPLPRYDGQVAVLRLHMEKVVVELVTNIRTSACIKRALLQHVVALARFFGRRDLNDLLLPLLITCLNAGEWALRSSFFTAVAAMGPYTGRESLDVFLLPCLEQALTDSEPSVVADAVMCIAAVATHLRKRSLTAAVTKVAPLLEHPSAAVRSAAVAMVVASATCLPPQDVHTQLASLLSPLLVRQPLLLADPVLLSSCLRSRQPPAPPPGEVPQSGGHHSGGGSSAGGADAPGGGPARKSDAHLLAVAAAGPSPRQHHSWGLLDDAMRGWGAARAKERRARAVPPTSGPRSQNSAIDRLHIPPHSTNTTPALTTTLSYSTNPSSNHQLPPGLGRSGDVLAAAESRQGDGHPSSTRDSTPAAPETANSTALPPTPSAMLVLRPTAPLYTFSLDPGYCPGGPAGGSRAAAPSGSGIRSMHGVGVASIASKLALLEGCAAGLRERGGGGEGAGLDPAERQQLDRITTLLARLRSAPSGHHPSSLSTFQLTLLSTRAAAAGPGTPGSGPGQGGPTGTAAGGGDPAGVFARLNAGDLVASLGVSHVSDAIAAAISTGITSASRPSNLSTSTPPGAAITPSASGVQLSNRNPNLTSTLNPNPNPNPAAGASAAAQSTPTPFADVSGINAAAGVAHLYYGNHVSPSAGLGSRYGATTGGGGANSGSSFGSGGSSDSWRPRGVLVAHMTEHRRGVNKLALTQGGAFLASASSDETVKVWDLRRLERDISFHSRLTYAAQSGRITALTGCEDDLSIASASSAGSIHVWRLELQGGGGGRAAAAAAATGGGEKRQTVWRTYQQVRRTYQQVRRNGGKVMVVIGGVGALRAVARAQPVGAACPPTERCGVPSPAEPRPGRRDGGDPVGPPSAAVRDAAGGGVHGWDLRVKRDVWVMAGPPALGLTQAVAVDPHGCNWILTGSQRGFLTLWDARFGLCVNRWQHPLAAPIAALAPALAPAPRLGLSARGLAAGGAAASGAPFVYVAAGHQEVGLWDLLDCQCHQVIRCLGPSEAEMPEVLLPAALQPTPTPPPESLWGSDGGRWQQQRGSSGDLSGVGGGSERASAAAAAAAVGAADGLSSPQSVPNGARTLLPMTGGQLLSGSTDRCIRYWEPSRPDSCYLVAGPLWPSDNLADPGSGGGLTVPQYRYSYRASAAAAAPHVPILEERCTLESTTRLNEATHELRQKTRVNEQCHADGINHMVVADSGSSRLLLTCSRDGCVKAWK